MDFTLLRRKPRALDVGSTQSIKGFLNLVYIRIIMISISNFVPSPDLHPTLDAELKMKNVFIANNLVLR